MLVCLVLSAATGDRACIECTANLNEKGYLLVENMAKAKVDDLKACIRGAGLENKRAMYLKGLAEKIMTVHGGVLPSDYSKLTDLVGVGRKSVVLMLNEAFGFYFGIETDSHVMRVSQALGMVDIGKRKKVTVELVEASLRRWIPESMFRDVNKIFGGFAQLVTQDMLNPTRANPSQLSTLRIFVRALGDRVHKPYEIQVAFFIIARLRAHYACGLPKDSPPRHPVVEEEVERAS
jgi:endonuclease III